jgi:hypothetical protein
VIQSSILKMSRDHRIDAALVAPAEKRVTHCGSLASPTMTVMHWLHGSAKLIGAVGCARVFRFGFAYAGLGLAQAERKAALVGAVLRVAPPRAAPPLDVPRALARARIGQPRFPPKSPRG